MFLHRASRAIYGQLRDRLPWVRGRQRLGRYMAHVLSYGGPVTVRSYGLEFDVDLRDRVEEGIFFEDYDRDILAKWRGWLHDGAVVLDVGANVGLYSLVAASAGARVFAFEPNPRTRGRLKANVERNDLQSLVTVLPFALTSSEGPGHLFDDALSNRRTSNSGVASLSSRNAGGKVLEIRTTTIDAFLSERKLERVDWVKMDIQGAELPALQGGRHLLERCKPNLILEFEPTCAKNMGWTEMDLRGFLREFGYEVEALDALNIVARARG